MRAETITLVPDSFAKVTSITPQAAALFYNNFFKLNSTLRGLFKGKKMMQMVGAAVGKLDQLDVLVPILQRLTVRHKQFGIADKDYATVGSVLLQTLEQGLGPDFTPAVKQAWTEAYGVMSSTMITAENKG